MNKEKQVLICTYDNMNLNKLMQDKQSEKQYRYNKYIIHNMWINSNKYSYIYISIFLKNNTVNLKVGD